jgi:redox-sensitive bicupin YhaK (pirin superfamily)
VFDLREDGSADPVQRGLAGAPPPVEVLVGGRVTQSRAGSSKALQVAVSERVEQSKVMIYSGHPIREPVAMGGPFVMNKPTEITQAFIDFHAGKFGDVPRQARLKYDR